MSIKCSCYIFKFCQLLFPFLLSIVGVRRTIKRNVRTLTLRASWAHRMMELVGELINDIVRPRLPGTEKSTTLIAWLGYRRKDPNKLPGKKICDRKDRPHTQEKFSAWRFTCSQVILYCSISTHNLFARICCCYHQKIKKNKQGTYSTPLFRVKRKKSDKTHRHIHTQNTQHDDESSACHFEDVVDFVFVGIVILVVISRRGGTCQGATRWKLSTCNTYSIY